MDKDDFRHTVPRFQEDNFQKNLEFVNRIQTIAKGKGCTAAQLALAYLLSKDGVIPLFGTKRVKYVLENADAVNIKLTDEDLGNIQKAVSDCKVQGARYDFVSLSMTQS